MNTYMNKKATVHYPFAADQLLPFPDGIISNLGLSYPADMGAPIVKMISAGPHIFNMAIVSQSGQAIGAFQYTGKKIINIRSSLDNVAGVLQLAVLPQNLFNCTGNYYLIAQCVRYTVQNAGYQTAQVGTDIIKPYKNKLTIRLAGCIAAKQAQSVGNYDIDITRTLQAPAYALHTITESSNTFVTSVNGIQGQTLSLSSSDAKLMVTTVNASKACNIYINSSTGFPTCSGG